MNILKKKTLIKTNNNYLDTYKFYLKNLNFFNNLKKRNNILLKDIILLELDNLFLLNINLKHNFFFSDIEENQNFYKNKNNLLYFFEYYNNYLKKMKINFEYSNYLYNIFYFKFLNNKLKKFFIHKFFIQKNNKIKKIYITKFNLCYNKIKKIIVGPLKKKIPTGSFGKIYFIKSKIFNFKKINIKKVKNKYLKKRFKYRFSFMNQFNTFFHKKHLFFNKKILNKNNKLKFYYARIKNVVDKKKKSFNENKINLKKIY